MIKGYTHKQDWKSGSGDIISRLHHRSECFCSRVLEAEEVAEEVPLRLRSGRKQFCGVLLGLFQPSSAGLLIDLPSSISALELEPWKVKGVVKITINIISNMTRNFRRTRQQLTAFRLF